MKASNRIGHQDEASARPRQRTVVLAVSRELHIRVDRQILAGKRRAIQDLYIGTGPFQPDSSTFEVAYRNQEVVDSSIFGILMEPSAEVLKEAYAAVLEVWPNTSDKLIQESTGHRVWWFHLGPGVGTVPALGGQIVWGFGTYPQV